MSPIMLFLQFIIKSTIMVVGLTIVWLYIKYFKRILTEGHIPNLSVNTTDKVDIPPAVSEDMVSVETKQCIVCKQTSKVDVLRSEYKDWQAGTMIQKAFLKLSPDNRELLISGTHPACWDQLFGKEE